MACAPTSQESGRTHGIGSTDRLTSAEWSAYHADQEYLQAIAPAGKSAHLNCADPRQYSFVLARLKLAGKNPENSPYLFELLDARRRADVARGIKVGALADASRDAAAADGREDMHYLETADPGTGASGRIAAGTAASTIRNGAPYTYVDLTISTITGVQVAPFTFTEEFDNPDGVPGANVTVSSSGRTVDLPVKRYVFDSLKIVDPGNGDIIVTNSRVVNGAAVPQPRADLPVLGPSIVTAPVDTTGDNLISICMDRAWTNDCDVTLTGAAQAIMVPLGGSVPIGIASPYVFDELAIQALRAKLNMGQHDANEGQLKLVLTNVGGGCDVIDNNTLVAQMAPFWNHVTLSANKRTLTWDLIGMNAAFFDEGCRQVQNAAKLTMRVPLPLISTNTGESVMTSITITNDLNTQPRDATILPITLTNSCLAEGTQIQLADGQLAAVEALHIGQSVFNPYVASGHALTITDTASGSERAPMVRIRDEAGHMLLMTEMHPISTADRGMVQARALRTGDVVMTQQGPSKLIAVTREPYAGKVYNLKVGSKDQMADLAQDQTIVYANGFVVGDGQIQTKYESLAQKQATAAQVPEAWRRDYLMSAAHRK